MEIGGIDIRIPSRAGASSTEAAIRAVRQHWRLAVYENADTAEFYEEFGSIAFRSDGEWFVYRDKAAYKAWDEGGTGYNDMIYIIYRDELVTLVVDERTPDMDAIVETIKSALAGVP